MKKVLKGIGTLATLLSLVLIIFEIRKLNLDISIFSGGKLGIFFLFTVLYTGLVIILGIPWGMYVKNITGKKVPVTKLNLVFTRSNLMKYIPGNIFQYVGRNEIAVDYELNHKDVVCATIMDVISLSFSGFLVAMFFSFEDIIFYLSQYISKIVIILLIVLALVLFVLFLLVLKKIKYFAFLFEKRMLLTLCKGIGILLVFHLCSAGMFCVTLSEVIGVELQGLNYSKIIGAWCVGYLAGYVVPGSPGGLGVREVTISVLLYNVIDVPVVALGTVFMRVANIVGEVASFLVALFMDKIVNRKGY